MELCKIITNKDEIINEQSVKKNKIAKNTKSSIGPTSFSLSFKIKSLVKLFKNKSCLI